MDFNGDRAMFPRVQQREITIREGESALEKKKEQENRAEVRASFLEEIFALVRFNAFDANDREYKVDR